MMKLTSRTVAIASAITLTGLATLIGMSMAEDKQTQPRSTQMSTNANPTNSVRLNQFAKNYSVTNPNTGKLSVEDRLEITDLATRFNWVIDTRQYDALAELFTKDGILDHDWGYVKGGQAIVELIKSHEADENGVRHQTTNQSLSVAEDGTVTMLGFLVATWVGANPTDGPSAPYIIAHGVQTFTVRQENGAWKIARLTLDQTVVNAANLPDKAIRDQISSTAEERAKRNSWY